MTTTFATTYLGLSSASFVLVLGIFLWVFLAFWPARVAYRKGHSFWLFFIFSLFFFPLALIVAYLSKDRLAKHTASESAEE